MFNFVKKYWIFIILATIATILGVLWANKPPESAPTQETKKQQAPTLERVSIPGKSIDAKTQITITAQPKESVLPILSLKRRPPLSLQEANGIALAFGFTIDPFVSQDVRQGQVYSWTEGDKFMSVGAKTQTVSFGRDLLLSPPPKSGQLPVLDTAKLQLVSLFSSAGLDQTGAVTQSRYISLSGAVPKETAPETAMFFEVALSPQFEGINLVNYDPEMVLARAWFDRQGKLARFNWQNPVELLIKAQEYQLKNKTDAEQSLLKEGKIVLVGDGGPGNPEPDKLLSVNVPEIRTSYLIPEEGSLVFPVFILTGEAKTIDGQSYKIWLYLPAVKDSYFQPSY